MATGSHNLIELLQRHARSQQAKNNALRQAVKRRRPDPAELAVAYGAEIASVPFVVRSRPLTNESWRPMPGVIMRRTVAC
jgi:hypothetical protein